MTATFAEGLLRMKRLFLAAPVLIAVLSLPHLAGSAAGARKGQAGGTSHLMRKISLPGDDGCDHIAADGRHHRLYVTHGTHVVALDTEAGKLVGHAPDTAGVHGLPIDHRSGHGFTSTGRSNSVTLFDLKTLKK